jgi:hypothetical protein
VTELPDIHSLPHFDVYAAKLYRMSLKISVMFVQSEKITQINKEILYGVFGGLKFSLY